MKKLIRTGVFLSALCVCNTTAFTQPNRISYNDQQLFLSGANLAWIDFARDIGPGPTKFGEFSDILLDMHDHGGNALRWWLHTNGQVTPEFDASDFVIGPGQGALDDLEKIFDLAWEREIGLKLCLWSFDMLRGTNSNLVKNRNRLMLTDSTYLQAYIDNALIPIVERFKDHPAVLAWEIFNEPEGMSNEFGWNFVEHVPMADIQRFINRTTGAIHRTAPNALVTSGAWSFITLSNVPTSSASARLETDFQRLSAFEKQNLETRFQQKYRASLTADEILQHMQQAADSADQSYYTDANLIAAGGDSLGVLDFYSVHYYTWAGTAWSPFHWNWANWGLGKPIVVAEFDMITTFGVQVEDLFETIYQNGYAGSLPWSWTDEVLAKPALMLAGMQSMWDNHREDVDVDGIGGDWPTVAIVSPENDAVFPEDAEITIQAEANDNDGSVVSVEFFVSDTVKIGEVTAPPYEITWSNIAPNFYTLTAVATDDQGHERVSDRVRITVGEPPILIYEAENALKQGSPTVVTDDEASGGAYLNFGQSGTVTWRLENVPIAGTYEISFRFKPVHGFKQQHINVNGVRVATMGFDGDGEKWAEAPLNVDLIEGDNTVQMELFWGFMELDYMAAPNFISTAPSGVVFTLTAEPEVLEKGDVAILRWTSSEGSMVTLNGAPVSVNDTLVVAPDSSQYFVVTAQGEVQDSDSVFVEVLPSGVIKSFVAIPPQIAEGSGGSSTLFWETTRDSEVTLDGASVGEMDSSVVTPDSTTSYTLAAKGAVTDSSVIQVQVVPESELNRAYLSATDASSSAEDAPSNLAVDGNISTSWVAGAGGQQWLTVNLNQRMYLNRIVLKWGERYATSYQIQAWNPGIRRTIHSATNGDGGEDEITGLDRLAKSVRVLCTESSDGTGYEIQEFEIYATLTPTSVADDGISVPTEFSLSQNYPNPFNPATTIRYALPEKVEVKLEVFNVAGKLVKTLVNEQQAPGFYEISFQSKSLATGLYFYRIQAGDFVAKKRMLLIK